MLVSEVHPVASMRAVFWVSGSWFMFVCAASGDHMVKVYCRVGLVIALYVASIVSFCFPHVVVLSVLIICIVFVILLLCCL